MTFFNLLCLVNQRVSDSVGIGCTLIVAGVVAFKVVRGLAGLSDNRCNLVQSLVLADCPILDRDHIVAMLSLVAQANRPNMRALFLAFFFPLLSTHVTAVSSLQTSFLLVGHREVQEAAASRSKEGVGHFTVLPPHRRELRKLLVSVLAHSIFLCVLAQYSA